MRWVLTIVGILMVLMGGVWILQGVNVLPGSFMTGRPEWAVRGMLVALVGLALLAYANLRRRPTRL